MKRLLILLAGLCVSLIRLQSAEYFVSPRGDDANPGGTVEEAFRTIQRGVNALAPGDTLTIAPGEYFESVSRARLGNSETATVIRAQFPGTVLLRGDKAAPPFKKVEGFSRVYGTDFPHEVQSVNEVDTLTLLTPMPSLQELEFRPGCYHYDPKARRLYISGSDLRSPEFHHYTVSVRGGNGIFLEGPVNVSVEGLAVTGFTSNKEEPARPGQFAVWGILLVDANHCAIRDVTAYLNGGGIAINNRESGGGSVIERCTAYGNTSPFSGSGGNILIFGANNDVIRHCLAYRSSDFGLRLYGALRGSGLIEDSLGWGNQADLFIKGPGAEKLGLARRSVAVGAANVKSVENVLIGTGNAYLPEEETPKNSIRLRSARFDLGSEFADPENFDFRLQSTSRYRRGGPGGGNRGPFAYEKTLFFAKPDGDDAADGLSVATAWKTAGRAARDLKPGDTLYLLPGVYPGEMVIRNDGKEPIVVRGRAEGATVGGAVRIEGSGPVTLERLDFSEGVRRVGGRGLVLKNCRLAGGDTGVEAEGVTGVTVSHCEFPAFRVAAIRLNQSRRVRLESNLFNNAQGVAVKSGKESAILYSGYNAYAVAQRAWEVGEEVLSLAALQSSGRENGSVARSPRYEGEGPLAVNAYQWAGIGALGKPIGVFRDRLVPEMRMTAPKVHSLGATTANIEWMLSQAAECELAWGETPACENRVTYGAEPFSTFSIEGLKPATTYYFRIRSVSIEAQQSSKRFAAPIANPEFDLLSFTTLAEPAHRKMFYVAPDGDDAHSGLSRDKAWRTLGKAAAMANAGDTVWVAGGTYSEVLRVRASGTRELPLTFRNLPGEKVVLESGGKLLEMVCSIRWKSHVVMDGFYVNQLRMVGGGSRSARAFNIHSSNDVTLSRCFYDARGKGYAPGFLTAINCRNLTVADCVSIGGFNTMAIQGGEGFVVENSVLIRPMIQISTVSASKAVFRNNIITDNSEFKMGVPLHEWSGRRGIRDQNNCYFLRLPDEKRRFYWMLNFSEAGKPPASPRMSISEYRQRVAPNDSFVADPGFPALLRRTAAIARLEEAGRARGKTPFPVDVLFQDRAAFDFADFFATAPEVRERGIGLRSERFADLKIPEGSASAGLGQ